MTLLLVSAVAFELEPTTKLLAAAGVPHSVATLGIGALEAAKSCHRIASLSEHKHVIFMGTCGAFRGFQQPTVYRIRQVHWVPTGERLGQAYTVKDTAPPLTLSRHNPLYDDLPSADAVCSPAISTTAELPEGFQIKPPVLENLELYSVAAEIQAVAQSFTALLTTTNAIGKEAHNQWRNNFKPAAELTAVEVAERQQRG